MFRKNYFTILSIMALFLAGSIAAFAQTAPVGGTVILTKADGTTEPVQGATVEAYRTDIGGKMPSSKTNKKGEFNFVAFQLGGVYTLAVSGPNIAPTYLPNIKAGMERVVLSVTPGDGKKLTEQEIRSGVSTTSSTNPTTPTATTSSNSNKTELSAEDKKKQEEEQKKIAEISAKNEKITSDNELIQASLKAGNEAFNSKNYDLAVTEYEKGIQARPTAVGSAPTLLNNKAIALSNRGV